jgi:hypothetical protein
MGGAHRPDGFGPATANADLSQKYQAARGGCKASRMSSAGSTTVPMVEGAQRCGKNRFVLAQRERYSQQHILRAGQKTALDKGGKPPAFLALAEADETGHLATQVSRSACGPNRKGAERQKERGGRSDRTASLNSRQRGNAEPLVGIYISDRIGGCRARGGPSAPPSVWSLLRKCRAKVSSGPFPASGRPGR